MYILKIRNPHFAIKGFYPRGTFGRDCDYFAAGGNSDSNTEQSKGLGPTGSVSEQSQTDRFGDGDVR